MCTTFRFGSISRNADTFPSPSNNPTTPLREGDSLLSPEANSMRTKRRSWRWLPALLAILLPAAGALAQSFGSLAVGSSSSASVTVTAQAAGAVSNVQILTLGTSGLDFAAGVGGNCTSANLSVSQQCSQPVTFTPQYPGVRLGAVVLLDSSNHVLGTAYLSGIGQGGLAVLIP